MPSDRVLVLTVIAASLFAADEALAQVKGTATFHERMALPPEAIFEVTPRTPRRPTSRPRYSAER